MVETAPWGDDSAAIEKQILSHNSFHSSIQRSSEVERARDELFSHHYHYYNLKFALFQKMSHSRLNQLRELQNIIEEISQAIIWVNEREEEELIFDWGDKNIDYYIPKKQESYSRLMRDLEVKEKDLNKLKVKSDSLLANSHPASDKIDAYMDTLQTQWSWLLQITKCIHVHLKENSAYSQFFKEANETYMKLQKQHETIRSKFTCDKNTPLDKLTELLKNLEKARIMENKRQVQSLVSKSKSIVRLKPRNPEEKSSGPIMVQALCDFKQDQKGIMKGNEGILKDNSQRSKWLVTGPGGLDMMIPSVCLLIPPPNPLSIGIQYYEAIMSIWNQLFINIKSLISWQYCLKDIDYINSLTITMLSKMRPEEYRNVIKGLETHYQEFMRTSQGSEMFGEEEKKLIQGNFDKAQAHYDTLVIQLPAYMEKVKVTKISTPKPNNQTAPPSSSLSLTLLTSLHELRRRLELAESGLTSHLHIPLGDNTLKALLQSLIQVEDIIKVHEARLTEKETSSLDPRELENQRLTLKQMKSDLEQKRDLLTSMESELSTAVHLNGQISDSFHKCDIDLSKYSVLVRQLTDRWRRIQSQIDSRVWDLEKQGNQLKHYQQGSTSLEQWIDNARKRQDTLQTIKISDIQTLMDHLNQQKALHSEIKGKKEKVEDVQKNADTCAASIKDYELQLASYSSGLETLLNVPIKRTMLQSPASAVRQEAGDLQTHYIELLTRSSDYYKFLGELLKNMEELKTSLVVQESQSKYSELLLEKDSFLSRIKLLEQDKTRQLRLEEELNRIKVTLESERRNKQQLQEEKNSIFKELSTIKSQYELKSSQIRQCESDRDRADRERLSLKSEIERLMRELTSIEERYKSRLLSSEKEAKELALKKESLEREIRRLQQRPNTLNMQTQTDDKVQTIDPSKLLFDSVRRKVTAHQLCDCGIISKATLDELLKGRRTVSEVAADIQVNLKGSGIIAGMTSTSQRKIPFTEAKNKNMLSPESALKLLEAQAATGYIVDPAFNEKMPVDTACSRGIVDTEDRDTLLKAEAASTGFKDPYSGKVLSVGQACKQGHIDKETTIRLLQAQESVGGILDPVLGVFLPKDLALDRNLIDEDLYRALTKKPTCYLDPTTGQKTTYNDLRMKCTVEPVSGLLLISGPEKPLTVKGLRGEVSVSELIESELLDETDLQKLSQGKLTSRDIEDKLKTYLHGSTCIAGIYDEANDRILPFYQAMKEGLLMRGTTLELLEAQAASGFIVDPVNNVFLTVEDASKRGLIGKEFKNKLLSAEKAVIGYRDPNTGKTISLFQAIEKDLIEKGHGIRLLEAQIASGGIIDPKESHRIDVAVAYKRGYFDEEMNEILSYEGDDTKGFFDPNTKENLTYLQLKERCIKDEKTGLLLLPLRDKRKPQKTQESRTNVLRKRRVVIVDPDTGLEMSVREAYHRELIDYDTFLDLSEQECEWEEITITGSDGSARLVIVDRKTGIQHDIQDCLERGVINQSTLDKYRAGTMTLTQFADEIASRSSSLEMTIAASNVDDMITCSSPTHTTPSSPTVRKRFNSISITVSPPEMFDDHSPVGAIFDTETLEKITVSEALRRGIVDTLTAQRLLEAQACTGGIINPATGERLSLQDAVHQSIIDESMASKLKPAQKAYVGFEDVKTKRRMSAAEAVKETWLPYEAGQRFLEFQYLTGGLIEPGTGRRVSIEEAIRRKWLDGQGARKLQDTRNHQKNLTCPKTKLKISYKEAMDSCMVEESNGMKMLQASSVSTKGISSPYNVSNPGSRSGSRAGSRTGSRSGSRRGSVDYTSTMTFTSSSSTIYSSNTHF
uniref:Desmoplakin a n=1 Tax=Astatotilapia calliptera TaxID=8154 RepID=A0A3P8QQI8_ASTCA